VARVGDVLEARETSVAGQADSVSVCWILFVLPQSLQWPYGVMPKHVDAFFNCCEGASKGDRHIQCSRP
jgi:hypothetical protein